ncbi:MAG TPA: S-methyl-5-thioribose-1-phosphate isomerase [Candidatus Angelobacter sp.]|nr:S-methyl-5-thioribose-1-phosphate isomerase [Candidatus Angelobacter sp.]
MEPFRLEGERLWLLDQTLLPHEERWIEIADARGMVEAIARLRVRGAPAIGIAAALGLWLEARRIARGGDGERRPGGGRSGLQAGTEALREAAQSIRSARPTAANIGWAVDRVLRAANRAAPARPDRGGSAGSADAETWVQAIFAEALAIWEEDRAASRAMARWGASLFREETRFLTHCHTGGLATGGGGTALGVLLELRRAGRDLSVWATETRPLLQGARLTAWELQREGIPVTVVADGAAASLLARISIQAVVVGADRIAGNGDVANKIGTYPLALAARERGIPFVVVAPTSTCDPDCPSGDAIPIEERDPSEVLAFQGIPTAPAGVLGRNPAFDVTPAGLVTAIITERGIHRGPHFLLAGVDTDPKSR